jgi:hypothetical protein
MRNYKQTVFTIVLFAALFATGKTLGQNQAVNPTSQPDRIVLSWSDDTATTQSVTWRTSANVRESFAELVEASSNPRFPTNKKTFSANRELVESRGMNYHSFSITFTVL